MTPNHADETQPAQHRTAGPGRGLGLLGQQHLDPAGGGVRGGRSQPPLLGGLGRHPPLQSQREEKHKVGATKSWRIDFTRVDAFRNNFLESGPFSRWAALALPCHAGGQPWPSSPCPPPSHAHRQSRRAGPRGPRVREGEGLAQSDGRAWAPSLRPRSSMLSRSLNPSPRGAAQSQRKKGWR